MSLVSIPGAPSLCWPCVFPDKAQRLLRAGDRFLLPTLTWHLLPGCPGPQSPSGCHLSLHGTFAYTGIIYTAYGGPIGRVLTPLTMSLWFTPPGSLTQAIRNFAKSLEGWLINAMSGFPQQVIQTKVPACMGLGDPLASLCCPGHFPCVSRKMGLPGCCGDGRGAGRGEDRGWPWR